jgi:hypothetical protein
MIHFIKRYYTIIFAIIIITIIFYQYSFIRKFKSSYKQDGLYTMGTIKKVEGYGRGTGFNFIYTFIANGKEYTSVCDVGNLPYSTAQKEIDKKYLVIYLSNDIHNNRLYSNIPLDDSLNNDFKIRKWIGNNTKIKSKIDLVPSPGYFLQNYF